MQTKVAWARGPRPTDELPGGRKRLHNVSQAPITCGWFFYSGGDDPTHRRTIGFEIPLMPANSIAGNGLRKANQEVALRFLSPLWRADSILGLMFCVEGLSPLWRPLAMAFPLVAVMGHL